MRPLGNDREDIFGSDERLFRRFGAALVVGTLIVNAAIIWGVIELVSAVTS